MKLRVHVVDRLAGVLLQVQALDADLHHGAVVQLDLEEALTDDGVLELADLIALRQVGIEVVLAVEPRPRIDLGVQAQARLHRLLDAVSVDHRQHARKGRVHQAHLLVRSGAKAGGRAGEKLGVGRHLGVDFEAEHDLPLAGAAFDAVRGFDVAHEINLSPS